MRGGGGHAWLAAAGALLLACGIFDDGDSTPAPEVGLDLYFFPPPTSDLGPWRQQVALDPRAGSLEVAPPEGGRSRGQVSQLLLSDEGLVQKQIARPALVTAEVSTPAPDSAEPTPDPDLVGLVWRATTEVDGNAVLRTPGARATLRVRPYDWTLPVSTHVVNLPLAEMPLISPSGHLVTGTLLDRADQPLGGVYLAAYLGRGNGSPTSVHPDDRVSGVALTDDVGRFALWIPTGTWWLWGVSSPSSSVRLPATPLRWVTVNGGPLPDLEVAIGPPSTTSLVVLAQTTSGPVEDVTVTAVRRTAADDDLAGAMTVVTSPQDDPLAPTGQVSLSLPDGTYDLYAAPGASLEEGWAAQQIAVVVSSQNPPIPETLTLVERLPTLEGTVTGPGNSPAAGVTLLFFPTAQGRPSPTAQTDTTGHFELTQALAPGTYDVVLVPPIGSTLARQSARVSLSPGQSLLADLPDLEEGGEYPLRLPAPNPGLVGTVVKAVPAGLSTWDLRWGPGPDPRDVVGEALVGEDGAFTLWLPTPLTLPVQ